MKRCFIFAAGSCYGLRERPREGDVVIAADGGYRICLDEGIRPDLVLGDFDSMDEPRDFPNVLRVPVEKDDTDAMLAARKGLEQGCREFHLYGGTGGLRLDHTLANFQLLMFLRRHGARGYLYDRDFVFTAVENESITVPKTKERGLLSVFAVDGPAEGVWEQGVQYTLSDARLASDVPMGVSNCILDDQATIRVDRGMLIVGWELPAADAILQKE